jgi:ubiquinone/menaquinone biosynthesis C-methylase UbiE
MTALVPLSETPLGITRDEIERLFAPFARIDDAEWRRRAARRDNKVWKQYLRRRFGLGERRLQAAVAAEYGAEWRSIDYRSYSLDRPPEPRSLWQWGAKHYLASNRGGTRVRQLFLVRAIELLQPRRVLEVGCGNGINLLLLAGRFPKIAFTGIDLTTEGIAAAKALQQQALLPDYLQAFAPLSLVDPAAFRRIDFQTGDASALPFADKSFDLVFTSLSLEQMNRIRAKVFGEIARVSSGHAFMIEPFRDANTAGMSRRYVVAHDYLRARIADLPGYGLQPQWATADMPQEAFLKAAAVLAKIG